MSNSKILYSVLGVLAVLVLWVWTGYNGLISSKAAVEGSWAQVETQYQRRLDLVPNLVSIVKGAANFEQSTLLAVTEARTNWLNATSSEKEMAGQADSSAPRAQQILAAQQFDSAFSRLLVSVEAYPQLQATQAFRDLMTQLEGTENRISTARRDYNMAVQSYNVRVARFPSNILAGMFGFASETMFSADEGADNVPSVQF